MCGRRRARSLSANVARRYAVADGDGDVVDGVACRHVADGPGAVTRPLALLSRYVDVACVASFCPWTARARVGRRRLAELRPGRVCALLTPPAAAVTAAARPCPPVRRMKHISIRSTNARSPPLRRGVEIHERSFPWMSDAHSLRLSIDSTVGVWPRLWLRSVPCTERN